MIMNTVKIYIIYLNFSLLYLKEITINIEKGMHNMTPLVSDKKTEVNENNTAADKIMINLKFFLPNNMKSVIEPKTKLT